MKFGRLLLTTIFLVGCSNGTPQVDFLKALLGEELFSGVTLKINGSENAIGNAAAPTIVISGFSDATKIELFSSATCDTADKVGEVTTSDSDTSANYIPTALTADGVYYYYAIVTSSSGVASDCSKNRVAYTYDATAPASPSAVTLVTTLHNTATPVVQVSGVEVGTNVALYSDAACTSPMGTSNGTASAATVSITSNSVLEGSHSYYAKLVDGAGNTSACTTAYATYIYDVTAPTEPSSIALSSGTVSPSNNINPSFDIGGLNSGDTVKVYGDSLCLTELASATVSAATMSVTLVPALSTDGTYPMHAMAVDGYGNASACSAATVSYVLDKTAPTKPSALALKTPVTSPGNNATPTITVSGVVVGDSVKLYTDATCTTQVAASTVSTGTTIDLTSSTLTEGSYDFYAQSTDAVGNASGCSTMKVTYVYDITPPSRPTSLALASPASSTSNVATPSFTVGSSLVAGDTVTLYSEASCSTAVSSAATVPGGGGSVVVALSTALSTPGNYSYYASAKDPAGNVSACSTVSVSYTFDNIAPSTPSAIALYSPSTSPANVVTPDIEVSGTTAGDTIYIYTNAACTALLTSGTATVTTTIMNLPTLTEGTYNFYAKAKDTAGNASSCTATPATYVLDLTPPAAPSSLALVSPGTNPGKLSTPMFQVNGVVAGDTVGLYQDAACTSLVISDEATGTSILLTSGALGAAGTYNYYAASYDPANNMSGCSGPFAYTYDNVSPTVSSVTSATVDRTYGPGSVISITLNMSEVVTVDTTGGSPTLTLNTSPARTATYVSGSGTNQLSFTYTVQLGDSSSDLDYANTTSLSLNGALIRDFALNNISTTMSSPGGSSSLALTRAIIISPVPPAVTLLGSPTMRLNEGAGAQTLTLSMNFPAPYDMTVTLFSYGNALIGVDYMLSSNVILIPSGSTTANITFTPIDNATVDIPRRLMLSIDSVNGDFYGMLNKITQKEIYLIDNDQAQSLVTTLPKSGNGNHQCAIKNDGSMYCWGANSQGQLGDNTSGPNKSTPVLVTSLSSGAVSATTGGSHTCAIKTDDTLWCWGLGSSGQLGLGSTSTKIVPFQVAGSFKKVAAGNTFTCAIKTDDTLWCWGSNSYRELGDGSASTYVTSPVQVSGVDTYLDVFAGYRHACGITMANVLKCWGDNGYAQASASGSPSSYIAIPTTVDAGVTYSKLSLGQNHSCGITTGGVLKCWGLNSAGQLGDGTVADKYSPTVIISSNVTDIAVGTYHGCAINAGTLQCWGANMYGQLGNGSTSTSLTPSTVGGSIDSVAAGMNHTCAVLSDGSMKCWGHNLYSQIGTGKEDVVKTMSLVETAYAEVSQSENHACGLTTSGAVRCWGANSYGQVGDGTQHTRSSPVLIIPNNVAQIATGAYGSCAVLTNGKLQCWGYNINGRLGDGTSGNFRLRPTDIIGSGVAKVAMGPDSTCALMTDSSVKCWGSNSTYGKVGNGSTAVQLTPAQVIAANATQVAVGGTHACAIVSGTVYCWGDNTYGQFGTPSPSLSLTPTNTFVTMSKISLGMTYSCGINSGDLFCWGRNNYSQLGDLTVVDKNIPTQIDLGVPYSSVSTYVYHTCGVTTSGSLKCWGNNSNGQMGASGGSTPTALIGSSVASTTVGLTSTCATMANGYVNCVGGNSGGQLGLGNLSPLNLPLDVFGL